MGVCVSVGGWCVCVRDLRELELNLWVPIQWSERGLIHNCITKGWNGIGAVDVKFYNSTTE